jgi:hypothetical protein
MVLTADEPVGTAAGGERLPGPAAADGRAPLA